MPAGIYYRAPKFCYQKNGPLCDTHKDGKYKKLKCGGSRYENYLKYNCDVCGCGHRKSKKAKLCNNCSRSKRVEQLVPFPKGPLHPSWNGGTSKLRDKIEELQGYKKWRTDIFERDNYICIICKIKTQVVNADHIIPLAILLLCDNIKTVDEAIRSKNLWDTKNGQTLCEACHSIKTKKDMADIARYKQSKKNSKVL